MSSTRRTPQSPSSAKNSLGAAEAVAAAGAADGASEAAQAAAVAAAAGRSDVAASARRERFPTTLTDADRDGRALLDPATSVLSWLSVANLSAVLTAWKQAVSTAIGVRPRWVSDCELVSE